MTEQDRREKVIEGLEHCTVCGGCYDCPYTDCDSCTPFCKAQLMRDALALLKAQEPVEPRIEQDIYPDETPKGFELYYCGYCGDDIVDGQKFCASCGRPVKWE